MHSSKISSTLWQQSCGFLFNSMKIAVVFPVNYLNIYLVCEKQILLEVVAKYQVMIYTFTVQIFDLYITSQSTGD